MIEARKSSTRRCTSLPPTSRVKSSPIAYFPPGGRVVEQSSYLPHVNPSLVPGVSYQVFPRPLVSASTPTVSFPSPIIQPAPSTISVQHPAPANAAVPLSQSPPNPNSQWELDKMRGDLSWIYTQLDAYRQQAVESAMIRNENNELKMNLQRAMEALNYLQKTQAELTTLYQQNYSNQNAALNQAMQQRLREAESKWHEALRNLELQKSEGSQLFANQRDLVNRVQVAEAEVLKLRQSMEQLRETDRRNKELLSEVQTLRQTLSLQENNIDIYAEETRSYFNCANSEILSLRQQVQALSKVEVESRRLRFELDKCSRYLPELERTRAQLVEVNAVRETLQVEVEQLTSEVTYLRGQLVQQAEKAKMATEELTRVAGDRTATILSEQLVESEREILRLRNIIAEGRLEADQLRNALQTSVPTAAATATATAIAHSATTPTIQFGTPTTNRRLSSTSNNPYNPSNSGSGGGNNDLQVFSTSRPRCAYFGVEVTEGALLTKRYGESNPIPGLKVLKVTGPSAVAGLQSGDIISSLNGCQVATLADFNAFVAKISPGDEVQVVFEREGQLLGTDVKTEEKSNRK